MAAAAAERNKEPMMSMLIWHSCNRLTIRIVLLQPEWCMLLRCGLAKGGVMEQPGKPCSRYDLAGVGATAAAYQRLILNDGHVCCKAALTRMRRR